MQKDLNGKTTKELRDLAKDLNITGRWDMTKEQLIVAILKAESVETEVAKKAKSKVLESAKEEQKIDGSAKSEECAEKNENKATSDSYICQEMTEERKRYISDAEIGALVAFTDGKRVRSAAITNRNKNKEMLKLITKAGQEFIVKYDDILWVRTGKRWPRGIYNLLTGGTEAYERAVNSSQTI